MKLLLIAPSGLWIQGFKGNRHLHMLNLAVVAALATPYFNEIKIVEEVFGPLDLDESADLVGITMMTCQAERGYYLADHFRRRGIRTICGGSHATFMTQECAGHFDAVVVNEAESVWDDLMADFLADRLKPVYRSDKLIDLKDLPIPRKELFVQNGAHLEVIQAGRGCPLGCEFCTVTQMYGKKFRTRPVEHIVEEIKRFNSKRLFFVDDNIFLSRSYALELCEALIPLSIKWAGQGSLELICKDEELLRLAARSGCVSLFVGIESVEQETLNAHHKQFNRVGNYTENLRKMNRAGILVVGSFIFGFEEDTPESFDKILDFAIRNNLYMVNCGILTPFPGSVTYDKALKSGKIVDFRWGQYTGTNLVWNHPSMSKEEIEHRYDQFRRGFYSWSSIARRFWANRSHPFYFLGLNLHLRRLYHSHPARAMPETPVNMGSIAAD
ncbi:MAG: B12-binding domain-containing radical SAM protein [Acidobacteriota bacterium]|nr:MAG: B12-binding domain-containing radical SAM protein [Acidobacteriota bacterium]